MNRIRIKGARRTELGRRLSGQQEQPVWHFGPHRSTKTVPQQDTQSLVNRMRRQVLTGVD